MFSLMLQRPKSPFGEHPGLMHFETSEPSSENNTQRIPVYKNSIPAHLVRHDQASGDNGSVPLSVTSKVFVPKSATTTQQINPFVDRNLLSGYDEYLRDFLADNHIGKLSVTPQGTLSLGLGYCMQVDFATNGALRIVNPQAHIAMAVDAEGLATAVMHPMGRVHHDGATALLMSYDLNKQEHKFAKLWQDKSVFRSSAMSFAYMMDSAGTRTTHSPFPIVSTSDISLPVFYNRAPHGADFKDAAERIKNSCVQEVDPQGNTVWNINNTIIKFRDGELRLMRPPNLHIRTSAVNGSLALSSDQVHCTASQGGSYHMFVRFGENKVHYDGSNFRIRTSGQSAGFDVQNRICLY